METNNGNTYYLNQLAKWVLRLGALAGICAICWYFRTILVYIIIAFVVSLIGQPIMRLLRKIKIGGRALPNGLLAVATEIAILLLILLTLFQFVPVILTIVKDAAVMNAQSIPIDSSLEKLNVWIAGLFPGADGDFNLVDYFLEKIRSVVSISSVSSALASLASLASNIGVGLFSVIFISFFFIKDDQLFGKIICALVPDRMEEKVEKAIDDIERLLSRYFIGLLIEMFGVFIANFLGLWLIARISISYALGISLIAGLLNIIPYVGPLIGEVIGVLLSLVLHYGAGVGLDVPIWSFALLVLGIMLAVQMIDNFLYQPLIYSNSIKSTPLEIFIVLLIAGTIGGTLGLLVGIPAYTVVRVIAARFFYEHKLFRRLIPDIEKECC